MKPLAEEKPADDLGRRAALTALSGMLAQGAQFVVGFAITPFLARSLGQVEFGLWALLQQFNNYLSLGQFRVAGMLRLKLAAGQERLTDSEKRRFTTASLYLLCLFTAVCTVGTVVASQHIAWFFSVPEASQTATRWTLVLLSVGFTASQFATIPGAAVKGENREYSMMGIRSVVVLGSSLLSALFIYLGWGLVGMGAGYALGYAAQCILFFHTAKKTLPWFGISEAGWSDVKEQALGSGWLLLSSVALLLSSSFDLMLVGTLFDPATAAQYYVAGALCRFLQLPVSIAIGSSTSGLAGLFGKGEFARLDRANRELSLLVLFVSGVAGAVVISLNASFVQIWMGKNYFAAEPLAVAIVLSSLCSVFITNTINLFDAAVEFPHRTFYLLTGAAAGIALSIILGARYGLWGFAFGQFLGRSLSWWLMNRYFTRAHRVAMPFPLRPAAAVAAIWGLCWYHPFKCESWLQLVVFGVFVSLVASVALYFAGIAASDRFALRARLARVLEKFPPRRRPQAV